MEVLRLVNKALSDDDIRRILGRDIKFLKYSDLDEFKDPDELLPNPKDYCVVLYEDRPDRGHWAGLTTTGSLNTSTLMATRWTRRSAGST